jgi:very-short-patch-repair endonuclease
LPLVLLDGTVRNGVTVPPPDATPCCFSLPPRKQLNNMKQYEILLGVPIEFPQTPAPTPPKRLLAAERSIFKDQLGLATRRQLLQRGITPGQIRMAIAQGRWERMAAGLYALVVWPEVDRRRLLAACLATGGVASHASAAWVWRLLEHEPAPLSVSVTYGRRPIRPPAAGATPNRFPSALSDVVVHHSRDLSDECVTNWRGIPTTKPHRTIVDFAGEAHPDLLDASIDAALARQLVTVEGLTGEALRLKQHGRRGPAQLVASLERRGLAGAPSPSVLESRALRLFTKAGIKVDRCETVVDGGRYRLDIQVNPILFVELDGYAYHWSPEHKRYDDARRNRLATIGREILVYDWTTVMRDGGRVVTEVKSAMAKAGYEGRAARARAAIGARPA